MATFVCKEYPTLTLFLPELGRNVQFASGQAVARDEEEANAIRNQIDRGYCAAYETDEETDQANRVLAERARKAAERARLKAERAAQQGGHDNDPGDGDED